MDTIQELAHDSLFLSLNEKQWKALSVLMGDESLAALAKREEMLHRIRRLAESGMKLESLINNISATLKDYKARYCNG